MPTKKALPLLTGGLNEKTRPDLIEDNQLQVCTNYEIRGDGFLHRRKGVEEYDGDLSTLLSYMFESVSFVSEPWYPKTPLKIPSDLTEHVGDMPDDGFILFVFGKMSESFGDYYGEYQLHAIRKQTTGGSVGSQNTWTHYVKALPTPAGGAAFTYYLSNLLSNAGITYSTDIGTNIDMAFATDSVFVADGVNNSYMISIDADGLMSAGISGIPAPTNKPRVIKMAYNSWRDSDWETDSTEVRLGSPGLFQCVYTVVTKTGEESNPSPMSSTLDVQFFEIDSDGADERFIEKVEIKDLSLPDVNESVLESIKYFKVYMRIIRYADGKSASILQMTEQFTISTKKNTDGTALTNGTTGNDYILTLDPTAGEEVTWENDIAPVAKTVDFLGGITMLGNVKTKMGFPWDFKYFQEITLSNSDASNHVDAIIRIRLWDADSGDANAIEHFTVTDFVNDGDRKLTNSNLIRLFDTDLTTPLMVAYNGYNNSDHVSTNGDSDYIDLFIKVPLMVAGSPKVIYLCWTPSGSSSEYPGVPGADQDAQDDLDESVLLYNGFRTNDVTAQGNVGIRYGRFMMIASHGWTRQQVWFNSPIHEDTHIKADFNINIIPSQGVSSNRADLNDPVTRTSVAQDTSQEFATIPVVGFDNVYDGERYNWDHNCQNYIKFTDTDGYLKYEPPRLKGAVMPERGTMFFWCKFTQYPAGRVVSIAKISGNADDAGTADSEVFLAVKQYYPGTESGSGSSGDFFYYLYNGYYGSAINANDDENGIGEEGFDPTDSNWLRLDGLGHWADVPYEDRDEDHVKFFAISYDSTEGDHGYATVYTVDRDGTFAYDRARLNQVLNLKETTNHPSAEFNYISLGGNPGATGTDYDSQVTRVQFITNKYFNGSNEDDRDALLNFASHMPAFDYMIGHKYSDGSHNNRINFGDTTENTLKPRKNMVKWTDVNYSSFPDLFFKQVKEPILKVMAAPSFLQFQYQNTFIIFTRNTINRFVLEGTADGWSGSAASIIEEKKQYGLLAEKSLTRAGDALFWLSEVGVIMWGKDGMGLISKNVVDVPIKEGCTGFYNSINNQYILHDNSSSPTVSYVYHIERNAWAKFEGLDVINSRILSGGSATDNINLILDSSGSVNKYPSDSLYFGEVSSLTEVGFSVFGIPTGFALIGFKNTISPATDGFQFYANDELKIDEEIMLVTSVDEYNPDNDVQLVYVQRGYAGTNEASHGVSSLIYKLDRDQPEIKSKDMFFEKGVLRRMKVDYEGGSLTVRSNMETLKADGTEVTNTNTIFMPNPNQWRGIALKNSRGNTVSFGVIGADTIKSIMYDLRVEE